MIIQTGNRTDIPAFYAPWFANRLKEGFVLVRNPYNKTFVTRYELNPQVVDLIGFCTKNPEPMFPFMDLLADYGQYWFVTITPYGRELEPNVPPKERIMESFRHLAGIVGPSRIGWRYDPIIINTDWTLSRHIETFRSMCEYLQGSTRTCVISFLDLYRKVRDNYPLAEEVDFEDQLSLTREFVQIASACGMTIKPCGESPALESVGADCSGCMTVRTFEEALGQNLSVPPNPGNRRECACYLTGDIGEYNTCGHLCRYCYANTDPASVHTNMAEHDPASPLLIGHLQTEDTVHQARQISWIDPQLRFSF